MHEKKHPDGLPPNMHGDCVWQGAYVFTITENNITRRGGITRLDYMAELTKSGHYFSFEYSVKRSLYIDDLLYTISDNKIKIISLANLQEISELELS